MDSVEPTEAQLICLASPVRGDVYETIRALCTASVGDIGRSMNRSAESLYYHVKALLESGLIKEGGRRPTQRKPEAVYEITVRNLKLPHLSNHPQLAEITRRAVATGLRRTERGYLNASRQAESKPELRGRMHIIRTKARLRPDDMRAFMEMIERASEFAKSHESEEGVMFNWSSVVYPEER